MKPEHLFPVAATLFVALLGSAVPARADGGDTLTISGPFHMDWLDGTVGADLAAVFDSGEEHTWTATLYGLTYGHWSGGTSGSPVQETTISAQSFDLQFQGPHADVLNEVVSAGLAGGTAQLTLTNHTFTDPTWDFSTILLFLVPPDGWGTGIVLVAEDDTGGSRVLFPTDALGYPLLGPEPFATWVETIYIFDYRAGVQGSLQSSDNDLVINGDLGTPIPSTLGISDASVVEGSRGSRKVTLAVRLTNTSDQAITVDYRTVDGTAVSGGRKADYSAASGTLTFQPGETSHAITIWIKSDRTVEPDETFTVELTNVVGTTLDRAVATVTILNDD